MNEDKTEELKRKLLSWKQEVEARSTRALNAYYASKPGRRDRALQKCSARGQLGTLRMKIWETESKLAIARTSETNK